MPFVQELDVDTIDQSSSLTPFDWTNGYMLYAFKITDGQIGFGTYDLQFKSATESAPIEASYAEPVNENSNMILYYQMLGRLELDQFKAFHVWWVLIVGLTLKKWIVYYQGSW